MNPTWSASREEVSNPAWMIMTSQYAQNICISCVQCRPNVFYAGPTLYKCYTNVLRLLEYQLNVGSMLNHRLCNAGPTLNQQWVKVKCLLGGENLSSTVCVSYIVMIKLSRNCRFVITKKNWIQPAKINELSCAILSLITEYGNAD